MNKKLIIPIIALTILSACAPAEGTPIPLTSVDVDSQSFAIDLSSSTQEITLDGISYTKAQFFPGFSDLYAYPIETNPDSDPRTFPNSFRRVLVETKIITSDGEEIVLNPGDLISDGQVTSIGSSNMQGGRVVIRFDETNLTYSIAISNNIQPE